MTRTHRLGDTATLAEIVAAKLTNNPAAQWTLPAAIQRHEAEQNRHPRYWKVNPTTHKLEEVKP